MRRITWGSVMNAITFICEPYLGHSSGSISYTRLSSSAQQRLRLETSDGVGWAAAESSASAGWSSLQRLPRAAFE